MSPDTGVLEMPGRNVAGGADSAGGRRGFLSTPSTRLGWWAVALAAAFVVLFVINAVVFMPTTSDAPWRRVVLPFYGIGMLACGLAAGIVGLIAVLRHHERSWMVWLTILPGLAVLAFVIGELAVPH